MEYKCSAGIVLYNPNINRLIENIEAVSKQVENVYCFDNGSDNFFDIKLTLSKYCNVILLGGDKNLGIATALNKIAERSILDKMQWLLTLDQDSICSHNMIKIFCEHADNQEVGIICPLMVDKRRPIEFFSKKDIEYVEFCITSGSFINLNVYTKVGGFDDWLFIDLVDDDYCYKMRLFGHKILRINSIVLDHELGELKMSKVAKFYLWLGDILHIKKIKALSYKRKVSPMRLYYATRNTVYLRKKYKDTFGEGYFNKLLLINPIICVLRGQNKIMLIKSIITGLYDGTKKVRSKDLEMN